MFNSNNVNMDFQFSTNKCDIGFFNNPQNDCDFSATSWQNKNPELKYFNGIISHNDLQNRNVYDDSREFNQLPIENTKLLIKLQSEKDLVTKPNNKSKLLKNFKPKITVMKIRTLLTRESLNNLPYDVHQHLTSLLPECDQIRIGLTAEDRTTEPSNTALTNEFFNRALLRYLWKLTNGKSFISVESFMNKLKTSLPNTLDQVKSDPIVRSQQSPMIATLDINRSDSPFFTSDYTFSDDNYKIESENITEEKKEFDYLPDVKIENEITSNRYSFNNSFQYTPKNGVHSINICAKSEFDTTDREFSDIVSNDSSQRTLSPVSDSLIVHRPGKYKRRLSSANSVPPTENKRPTRSTAGQLPARLKSSSPQPGYQGTIMSALLNRSHSPKITKPSPGRNKKSKEKRKYKSADISRQTENDIKPVSCHNDTILLNLRTKLSNRIQKNAQKDCQHKQQYRKPESTNDFQFYINGFNNKSPRSLSPESDKLAFVNSPMLRNGHNVMRHLKYKHQYFDNQTPNSPQWSFSSEFTSQSSVESVLSQKNIRIDLEDVSAPENLLDDMDSEEMPPPRRTLTVAAMREKMRAKKMAKEEKRKDFDRDLPFDTDKSDDGNSIDMNVRHCHVDSDISRMMGMPRDNDDGNNDDNDDDDCDDDRGNDITNEFDSFLIDDYHVEIDDKILNYSDDLDDLLMSGGGNESLLEIIMKDPDAMEITSDNFSILNSDCQHHNMVVSGDQSKCSMSSTTHQSHCRPYTSTNCDLLTSSSISNDASTPLPVTSVCHIDNSLLSQALTSVMDTVDTDNQHNKSNSKDASTNGHPSKSSLQNAYLVDGNGLSDALKLIQSLNPGAKVTTQQFFLVNSGPQLVLSQAPPLIKSCASVQSTTTSKIPSNLVTAVAPGGPVARCTMTNSVPPGHNTLLLTNTKPPAPPPILSSALSVLPQQLSTFTGKPSNFYSINSDFTATANTNNSNKFLGSVANLGAKVSQYQQNTVTSTTTIGTQQSVLFGNQKPMLANPNVSQNTIGIRLQLAQNFQNGQHLNIIQSTQGPTMISNLMNQPLQFITPQQNSNNSNHNNISIVNQAQQMSKLVLLYPNLNCSNISSDLITCQQKQEPQQLILLSQPPKESSASSLQTFQVVNTPQNIWQPINHNLSTMFTGGGMNNLVLMNPQSLGQSQAFSFNYHQPQAPPLLMMSTNSPGLRSGPVHHHHHHQKNPSKSLTAITTSSSSSSSLSITVSKSNDDDKTLLNLNSNSSSQNSNSCVEQLSNSSSSAKSSCQLSKCLSDNLTDSDQEKSINSPQIVQLFNGDYQQQSSSLANNTIRSMHLTVDIDSPKSTSNNYVKTASQTAFQSPETDYDQSDFEIPCLYSQQMDSSGSHHNPLNGGDYFDGK